MFVNQRKIQSYQECLSWMQKIEVMVTENHANGMLILNGCIHGYS